ncbi:voltage-dependent ion-selective channel [Epithele typhae]|uniref:voltage-dependent ion-selective channel n=1 Tax=Epithele typhae TaxID=378194 RepID=UPI002007BEB2|nr:voltage-dependent ion-selective channel [Epithele typhae]KAH9933169.1 voltage-dependent ion-selective channel [Epithele typhae]
MSLPQPVPPSWKDLGKSSNDLLSKEFQISGTSLEVKTVTPSNVFFKVGGSRDTKSQLISGDIEAKFINKPHGLTFTQTWTTANVLKTQVEVDNQIAKGVKLDLLTQLTPDTGAKAALFTTVYKQPGFHTRAFLDIFKGPTFTADAVVGRDGFLLGAEASYNVTEGKITKYAAAAGYHAPEYAVTLQGLSNLSTFAASYYHRVNQDVEAGAKAVYDTRAKSNVSLEVGTKVYLDSAAYVKAKINNSGILALGYTQSLRPGVKASFGLALDTQRINDVSSEVAAHKVGASLTFQG